MAGHSAANRELHTVLAAARRAWNKAAREIAAWPKIEFTKRSLRGQLLLPLSEFAASLEAEVNEYMDRLSGENAEAYFGVEDDQAGDGDGNVTPAAKPLWPLTIASKIQRIKVAANALHRSGLPLAKTHSLPDLVTPIERPKAISRAFR